MRTLFAPVTVYTQPNCQPCRLVKKKLEDAGVAFDEVDLTTNSDAHTYITKVLMASAVPVIVTDTHEPIIGLSDPDKLDELIDYYTASETGL